MATVFDYAHESFPACHRFISPDDISHVGADILTGCTRRLLSTSAIRFHGPKYLAGETRRFVIVFIDPRCIPLCFTRFYDALEATSPIARKSRRVAEISPGEALIAWHKILQLLSLACHKAGISWDCKRKCKYEYLQIFCLLS